MTFEEKAFKDGVYNTKFHCPEHFGYEEKSECKDSCRECWDREYWEVLRMDNEVREEIEAVLTLLKSTLVSNHVSMELNNDSGEIIFFDTAHYLKEHKFSGFSVKIDNLVR